jgi:hypothetical protein
MQDGGRVEPSSSARWRLRVLSIGRLTLRHGRRSRRRGCCGAATEERCKGVRGRRELTEGSLSGDVIRVVSCELAQFGGAHVCR